MDTTQTREKRANLIAGARGIIESADAENRALTSEEQEQIDRVFADADALKRTIDRQEQIAAAEADMQSFQRRTVEQPTASVENATEAHGTASAEYRSAFGRWLRTADRTELRALEVGTASEGGNIVDDEMAMQIVNKADEVSFVRSLSNVMAANSDIKVPVESTRLSASIVAEEGAYSETDPAWGSVTLGSHKLATLTKVSEELMYDSEFDLSAWLSNAFGRAFGLGEDQYLLTGSGSGQPTGLFNESGTGAITAAAVAAITADELMDMYHAVAPEYRVGGNCAWVMHDSTAKSIRKLTDSNSQYLWQPGLAAGEPDTLLGRPVYLNSNIDELATGNKTVAFCNFDYFYIVDRGSIAVQRLDELYAGNGQVGMRAYKRFDGRLVQAAAASILTMA